MIVRKIWKLIRQNVYSQSFSRHSSCGHSYYPVVNSAVSYQASEPMTTVRSSTQQYVIPACPNCKNPVPPNANFCPMCGFELKI